MIRVTCECGQRLKVKDEYAGRRAKCPKCGRTVRIPGQREASDASMASLIDQSVDQPAGDAADSPAAPVATKPPSASRSRDLKSQAKGTSVKTEKASPTAQRSRPSDTASIAGPAEDTSAGTPAPPDEPTSSQQKKAAGTSQQKPGPGLEEPQSQPPAEGSSPSPRQLGPYVMIEKIGAGAMGEVWRARDSALERDVAIKLLPSEVAQSSERLERFVREARLAAQLNHTNVVTVYQFDVDEGQAFIVMEYVDGPSLDKLIEADGPLPWRQATEIIRDACRGLAAAHELGLIHRDIKPANLMRTEKGVTKVVDFGLAREQLSDTNLTREGQLLGTPAFMAPEQWAGKAVDGRTDLYSLICSYYFLLTGRCPFEAPSVPALGYQHRHEPLPDPREHVSGIPDAVCRVLARGANKEPEDRYQDGTALAEYLERVLKVPEESLSTGTAWEELASKRSSAGKSVTGAGRLVGAVRAMPTWVMIAAVGGLVTLSLLGAMIVPMLSPVSEEAGDVGTQLAASEPESETGPLSENADDGEEAAGTPEQEDNKLEAVTGQEPSLRPDAQQPAADQPATQRPAQPPRDVGPTTKSLRVGDVTLPAIEEVAPQWLEPDPQKQNDVVSARRRTLQGLSFDTDGFTVLEALRVVLMPPAPPGFVAPPGRAAQGQVAPKVVKLPQRFIISGDLGAVRVSRDSTWVFVWDLSIAQNPDVVNFLQMGASQFGTPPLPPWIAVKFPGTTWPTWMADYRAGDPIDVVVRRKTWGQLTLDTGGFQAIPKEQRGAFFDHIGEFQVFGPPNPPGPMQIYWCLEGEGIQLSQRDETWIDPKLGRAAELANAKDLERSPGLMFRNLVRSINTQGILVGEYAGISKGRDSLVVKLNIPRTAEGTIPVLVEMGKAAQPDEFLDYDKGDLVHAVVRLERPAETGSARRRLDSAGFGLLGVAIEQSSVTDPMQWMMQMQAAGLRPISPQRLPPSDPLTSWMEINCSGTEIVKAEDPTTVISSSGPRRKAQVVGEVTFEQAAINPQGFAGNEAAWSGKLSDLVERDGVTQLSFASSRSRTVFEAFTDEKGFIDELPDYVSYRERSDAADEVLVTGTIAKSDSVPQRFSRRVPLLRLTSIQIVGREETRAVPGQTRDPSTIDNSRRVSGLAVLMRNPPAVGQQVTFRAEYRSYQQFSNQVTVVPGGKDARSVSIKFSKMDKSAFESYKRGNQVQVVGTVTDVGLSTRLKLDGQSIKKIASGGQ